MFQGELGVGRNLPGLSRNLVDDWWENGSRGKARNRETRSLGALLDEQGREGEVEVSGLWKGYAGKERSYGKNLVGP